MNKHSLPMMTFQNAKNQEIFLEALQNVQRRSQPPISQPRIMNVEADPLKFIAQDNLLVFQHITMEEIGNLCRVSKNWYLTMDQVLRMKIVSTMGMKFYHLLMLELDEIFGPEIALNIHARCEKICQTVKTVFPFENIQTAINETLDIMPIHHLNVNSSNKFMIDGKIDFESWTSSLPVNEIATRNYS